MPPYARLQAYFKHPCAAPLGGPIPTQQIMDWLGKLGNRTSYSNQCGSDADLRDWNKNGILPSPARQVSQAAVPRLLFRGKHGDEQIFRILSQLARPNMQTLTKVHLQSDASV